MNGLGLILLYGAGVTLYGLHASLDLKRAVLRRAAKKLRLRYVEEPPFGIGRIGGRYKGCEVRVESRFVGPSKRPYSRLFYSVYLPRPLGLGLSLTTEDAFSRLFGGRDIQVDDASFDDAYRLEASEAERLRAFLTPERRLRIHRLLQRHPGTRLEDERIRFEEPLSHATDERIVRRVKDFVRFANDLGRPPEADDRAIRTALEARRKGDLDAAVSSLRDVARARRDGEDPELRLARAVEARLLEGTALYVAGRYRDAERAFSAGMEAASEGDPGSREELRRWRDLARWRAEVSSGAPGEEEPVLDARAVARALLAGPGDDAAHERRFESDFHDRVVRARGPLRDVDLRNLDAVFGEGPFTRLTLTLPPTGEDPVTLRDAQVIACLPAGSADALRAKVGRTVVLRGILVAFDPFGRTLYLDAAEVEA